MRYKIVRVHMFSDPYKGWGDAGFEATVAYVLVPAHLSDEFQWNNKGDKRSEVQKYLQRKFKYAGMGQGFDVLSEKEVAKEIDKLMEMRNKIDKFINQLTRSRIK